MTSATPLDHAFVVLVLGIVFPIVGWWAYRRFLRRAEREGGAALIREYKVTILWLVGLGLGTGLVWWVHGRPAEALGFRPDESDGLSVGLFLGACLALGMRPALALASPKAAAVFRRQLAPLEAFLPRTREQLRWGLLVSLAAGLFEEIAYRGYLMAYVGALGGSTWVAIAISALLFGCAHAYQGWAGTLGTALLGAAFAWLYVESGSLVIPILLHVLIDVSAMLTAYIVLRHPAEPVRV